MSGPAEIDAWKNPFDTILDKGNVKEPKDKEAAPAATGLQKNPFQAYAEQKQGNDSKNVHGSSIANRGRSKTTVPTQPPNPAKAQPENGWWETVKVFKIVPGSAATPLRTIRAPG